jgi:hypothetical protein
MIPKALRTINKTRKKKARKRKRVEGEMLVLCFSLLMLNVPALK